MLFISVDIVLVSTYTDRHFFVLVFALFFIYLTFIAPVVVVVVVVCIACWHAKQLNKA